MPMTTEEIALERERRAQQQRVDALHIASRHFHNVLSADEVVAASEKFHKFLTS